jgi:hypothetical protein
MHKRRAAQDCIDSLLPPGVIWDTMQVSAMVTACLAPSEDINTSKGDLGATDSAFWAAALKGSKAFKVAKEERGDTLMHVKRRLAAASALLQARLRRQE